MKNLIFTLAFLVSTLSGYTQQVDYNLDGKYIANGYDVVSYFEGEPKKGKKRIEHTHENIKLKFSSQSNLEAFISEPDKYLPAYGGWCAYAMGVNGEKVTINPKTYEIRDGKLLLFYNSWGTNTLKKWTKEGSEELAKKADKNWEEVKYKK